MATLVNPSNPAVQKALDKVVSPPNRYDMDCAIFWASGFIYLLLMYGLWNLITLSHWATMLLFICLAVISSAAGGIVTAWRVHVALKKRDQRRVKQYRDEAQIIEVSDVILEAWDDTLVENGIMLSHPLAPPLAHFDLFVRLRSLDDAYEDANDADRERLLTRMKEPMAEVAANIAAQLEQKAAEDRRLADMEANAHHDYINGLIGPPQTPN